MSKKSPRTPKTPTLSRRTIEDLSTAEQLLDDGKPVEACQVLEELDRRHPGMAPVLELLMDVYYELRDMHGYEWACYRLNKLDPEDADLALALAVAYLGNFRPALAIQTLEKFLHRWSEHESAGEARQTLEKVRQGLKSELEGLNLPESEALELARQHEEARFFMDHGQYPQSKQVIEKLLKRHPAFVPALNNLSQIYELQGETERAIELCRKALEIQTDNIHALSNLTRALFLSGKMEESAALAEQLKASQALAADFWTKKAEALSFLGDDQGIVQLYREAKAAGKLKTIELNPLFLHLAAVAHWRQGHHKQARRLWKEALKLEPGYSLAQDQLDDLEKPVEERIGPWYFPLNTWVKESAIRDLLRSAKAAARRKQEGALQTATNKVLLAYPELVLLAPHLLQLSDSAAIDFVIHLAGISHHPDLLAALKDFILGQRGSDEQRINASQIVSNAGLLPSGAVRMWIKGEWRDIILLNFEITDEVTPTTSNPEAARLAEEGFYALQDNQPEQAQQLLEQAIAQEPDSPTLLNNLALALEMQGQSEEAKAMILDIHRRFPDYFFGILGMARLATIDGDYAAARSLLDGLMQRRKLHYSEYDALCMAQIDLCLAENNKDAARSWFEMWESVDPDNPKLEMHRWRLGLMHPKASFKKRLR